MKCTITRDAAACAQVVAGYGARETHRPPARGSTAETARPLRPSPRQRSILPEDLEKSLVRILGRPRIDEPRPTAVVMRVAARQLANSDLELAIRFIVQAQRLAPTKAGEQDLERLRAIARGETPPSVSRSQQKIWDCEFHEFLAWVRRCARKPQRDCCSH